MHVAMNAFKFVSLLVFCVLGLSSQEIDGIIMAYQRTSPEKLSMLVQNDSSLSESSYKTFNENPKISDIAIDHKKSAVFLYMAAYKNIVLMEDFNGTLYSNRSFNVVRSGLPHGFGSMAFDWLTENLYWTDNMHNWIAMQPAYSRDETMFKIVISDGLRTPEGITVDPFARYLFWSDSADGEKIERSSLSGSQRTLLVFKAMMKVSSIVADVDTQQLYWVDYYRKTLESCDYNGQNRHVISKTNGWNPKAVDITSTHIFTAIYNKGKVLMYNKKTEEHEETFDLEKVRVIRFLNNTFHERQLGINRCQNTKCPHMCVNTADDTGLCICKEGFEYFPLTNACRATTNYFSKGIVVTDGSRICMVNINAVSNGSDSHRCTYIGSSLVGAITAQRGRIIYHETTTKHLQCLQLNGAKYTYIFARNVGSVSELEYDWADGKLFWIDDDTSCIKMINENYPSDRTIIADNLRDPRSLTIDIHARILFWSDVDHRGGSKRRIYKFNFTDSSVSVMESLTTDNPKGLFIDIRRDRLFWIDEGAIRSIRTDETQYKTYGSISMESNRLLVYQDYAVWTNSSPVIFSKYLSKKDLKFTTILSDLSSVTDMVIYDPNLWKGKKGKCTIDNGGCEQICLPGSPVPICKCELGFKLQMDKKSCSSGLPMQNFALISDANTDRIYQISLNGSVIQGIKIEGLDNPLAMRYHPGLQRIFVAEYSGQLKSAAINGSDVMSVFSSGSAYPRGIEIHLSTNQLFFTLNTKNANITKSSIGVIRIDTLAHKTLVHGLDEPDALVIHPAKGFLFWSDKGSYTHIGRSSLDGSWKTTIITTDIKWPNGLAIDYKADLLYWADGYHDKIEYCDLNGGDRREVLVDDSAHPSGLIVKGSFIYYTAWDKRKVTKADKRTGQIIPWMSDNPEFGRLDAIDFFPKDEAPENSLCKSQNGGCSTFCFPTARSRSCGCEDGINLLQDRKRCENVDLCPEISIRNGKLTSICFRYANQKCEFTCNAGSKPKNGIGNVTCGPLGGWLEDMEDVCEEERLPKPDDHRLGIIVGSSVGGGILAIAIVTALLIVLKRRRQNPDDAYVSYTPEEMRKSDGSTYVTLNF